MRPLRTLLEALAGPMVQTILVLRILVKLHELLRESMKAQLEVGFALATNGISSGKAALTELLMRP
jgi:hypothetical protein